MVKYCRGWVVKNTETGLYINGEVGKGKYTDNILKAEIWDDVLDAQGYVDYRKEKPFKEKNLKPVKVAVFEVEE